jgi:sugar phosphate isomerase/epimerase
MFELGLKVWSTNRSYLGPARSLHRSGAFDFVEVMVPGDGDLEDVGLWAREPYTFVLHAPHTYCGLNMAAARLADANRAQMARLEEARRLLKPCLVVFHSGMNGSVGETIRQIGAFQEAFPALFAEALIENKPRQGAKGETCVGASPDEIRTIVAATGLGFCLDIGHASCYANWAGRRWQEIVAEFVAMKPRLYHLSDGDARAFVDSHEHLGQGSFDLARMIAMIPPGARITIETKKDSPENLDCFLRDLAYMKEHRS